MIRAARLLLLVLVVALPACGRDAPQATSGPWGRVEGEGAARRLVRADGTSQALPVRPRRVVSLLPSLTECVAGVGGVELLVGVSPHCNFPPEVLALPKVGVMPIEVEGLAALAPDLVLADPVFHASSVETLERLGLATLAFESRSLEHLATTLTVLGEVLDTPESRRRAAELVRELDQARERVRASAASERPRVLLVGQADPLHVLGPGALLDDMLAACGAENVAADLGRPSGPFSEEAVLVRKPDWILTTWEPLPERLRERWARVPAVARGRLALANADDLLRAGPRTPQALERLAAVLRGALPIERLSGSR